MSAAPVISLEDVQFGYGTRLVLDIPRLWVEQGSSVLLRGISGGGKSTCWACWRACAARGRVEVAGHAQDVGAAARDRFRADQLGVIFQQFNLLPFLTVRDNIALGPSAPAQRTHQRAAGCRDRLPAAGPAAQS